MNKKYIKKKIDTKDKYFSDYPTEPCGGSNPYYKCVFCGRTDPQINGKLENHLDYCEYRKKKEAELSL